MTEGPTATRFLRPRALHGEPHKTHHVATALAPRRELCSMTHIERDHSFSWPRCVTALVSYFLLLSDVLRTGPALRGIPKDMFMLEPDCAATLGPEGYRVNHLTLVNATDQAFGRYWSYKYDTTSMGMRALAQHLHATSWPPCLLYRERCDETRGLALNTVFTMIDGLVAAVNGTDSISLRINSLFRNSLHHYATPWFFEYTLKRTTQATSYNWQGERMADRIICDPRKATRPYMCEQTWASRLKMWCVRSREECQKAGRISEQIRQRIRMLARFYPNKTIESVIVDSTDDYAHGSMILPGFRGLDVVLLSRVRSCTEGTCSTVAVDDYRFETTLMVANVGQWFGVVAPLRVMGQAYMWLRVLLLFWICHVSRRNASQEYRQSSRLTQCRTVVRTIFLVPSQVVVYGSLVPTSLYYLAHLIDSPVTYKLVYIKFDSLLGSHTWNTADIVNYCTVSMRTVWVLGFYCHLIQAAWTRCAWSPTLGIPGISEFVITFIASLTLIAQYRVISMRNSAILEVFEVIPSGRMNQLRSYPRDTARTGFSNLLFGTILDWKCLLHASIAVAVICAMLSTLHRVFPRYFPFQVSIASRTLAPHAASYLWPRDRLVVSWLSSLVTMRGSKNQNLNALMAPRLQLLVATVRLSVVPAQIKIQGSRSQRAQRVLVTTARRSRETESVIYLMNFAAMTDPTTLLQLRFFSGRLVAMYQSKKSHQFFLLPYDVRGSSADNGIDWNELRLVAVVNTKDLEWDDLLRCG